MYTTQWICWKHTTYGLFPLPESDSDSKPYGYIVLYRSFSTAWTWTRIPFPNGYCTYFRDGSPSQGQISIPITYISIRRSESESKPVEKFCIVQESLSESGSESDSGSENYHYSNLFMFRFQLAQLALMASFKKGNYALASFKLYVKRRQEFDQKPFSS